jgi:hypothetical protein
MTSDRQPFHEPFRSTILRTGLIAIIGGAVLARFWGDWARWPAATLVVLWLSLGGHYVEVWFLNWLRPRLPGARGVQVAARVTVWFVGGIALALGMRLTAKALRGYPATGGPAWWLGGVAFIGIELVVHLALQLRGRAGFYNGHG